MKDVPIGVLQRTGGYVSLYSVCGCEGKTGKLTLLYRSNIISLVNCNAVSAEHKARSIQ